MNLLEVEKELKQRISSNLKWGIKRVDIWETQTDFVKEYESYNSVNAEIFSKFSLHARFEDIRNYALSKWYLHLSKVALINTFMSHSLVRKLGKEADFYIDGISFKLDVVLLDHLRSTTMCNDEASKRSFLNNHFSYDGAVSENTLVLSVRSEAKEPWQCLSDLSVLKDCIFSYLNTFKRENLYCYKINKSMIYSDLICYVQ